MPANRVWEHKKAAALALFALFALAALLAFALSPNAEALAESTDDAAGGATGEGSDTALEISSLDELAGKKIGMVSGVHFDVLIIENVKGISQDEISYFNSNAELVGALRAGKIDAMIVDSPIAQLAVNKNEGIGIVPQYVVEDHYGYVLEKGAPLTAKINERLEA